MDKQRKKQLAEAYTQTFRAMGVYQIRNAENGKVLVRSSMDLDGARNRFEFMKQMNNNTLPELKAEWDRYGGGAFAFEELDRIKPKEETVTDRAELKKYQDEVDALAELWIEKLQPFGERGYHRPKS
ncbi:GIY-YIG nuclease family protein [Cohnella rhizosphaerae]|uniref:GIY-YIG nuclease family protein n=1 Tax=Cohnella rhizosphaerae TaxID=1457232 RepID=A0A9X4KP23_9BACL|nr:GIY-YIG nuclease family protein [Cohnella rhizosphaerae]MDG0807983.1 GIY-YIG nuclease family protein [Cohnella rhizosphaerae]